MTDEIDLPTAYQPAKQISFFAQLRCRCRRDERRNQTLRSFDLLRNGACRECFGLKACVMSRVDRSNFATLGQQHAGCFRIPAQFRLARGGKPNFRRRCVKIALESETKMGVAGKTQLERKRG